MADKRKTKKRKEEFEETEESEKPTSEEYAVAKWLKANVPTKKTKFLNHHVEYFTGTKAVDALLTSKWATGKNRIFKTRLEVTDFLHQMLLHKLFHRAKKVPVSEQELKGKSKKKDLEKTSKSGDEKDGDKAGSACEGKDTKEGKEGKDGKEGKEGKESEKKKRKIRLEMHMDQIFLDTNDAYVWIYDPMPWYYWVCGALVVFGTITVCMFPLWPATVRKGVYYLSIAAAAFLVMIIALTVLRVVIFCVVWLVTLSRHHLWLLPNLTEDVGFFASFWPLYKYEYRGPGSESDKASKNKKKRKKDKHSDDEGDEKTPLVASKAEDAPAAGIGADLADREEPQDDPPTPPEKHSESESENSQRSSTDRDFEIVEPGDVEDEEPREPLEPLQVEPREPPASRN
ncbi:translocation protein SEC62 isoform X2 [Pectinophora gossypiella]|uniref:translocation protein SEC62 isoform X2 n=1 Tax=Pectinophora gossypiella TaxID=13191 RepID=UPI00214E6EC3|nr:translocation protein SEC62 isoform X2 [Pectinophora gossypiella]